MILVGNGGGYGYGVMGSSHHALEDYGCLLTYPTCGHSSRLSTPMCAP